MSCFKKRNSLLHSSSVKESRSNLSYFQNGMSRFYLGQQQNFFFVYQIQIICDQKRFSRLSKGGHFSTTSGLVATCSRHALRKVCLQLGRERHSSRARPSPRATLSRRPPSSVLVRKVPIITNCALIKQKKAEITFLCDFCFLLFFCLQLIL